MDTEVMMIQSVDFESACTTPYISAPSSPQRFGTSFFSAPTSPTRISALYEGGDIVIKSEETDDIHDDDDEYDFAFDFGGQSGRSSISAADELFDGGKIMPLMTPIGSPQRFKEMLPPRNKMKAFAAAMKRSKRENVQLQQENGIRGRERSNQNSSSSSSHKQTRSLSDMRISDMLLIDHDENLDQENTDTSAATATATADDCSDSSSSSSISSLISLWNGWNLKDLLLFRSASESRASSSTEELKKYELAKKVREVNVIKNSSSKLASKVKRKDSISAHELHYRMKREMLKEMKKKTFLPYKQGLLGCSGFDDTVAMSMSRRL